MSNSDRGTNGAGRGGDIWNEAASSYLCPSLINGGVFTEGVRFMHLLHAAQ